MRGSSKILEQCLLCAATLQYEKIVQYMFRLGIRKPSDPAVIVIQNVLSFPGFQAQLCQYVPNLTSTECEY